MKPNSQGTLNNNVRLQRQPTLRAQGRVTKNPKRDVNGPKTGLGSAKTLFKKDFKSCLGDLSHEFCAKENEGRVRRGVDGC